MCGFNDLEREEKILRAYEILNSNELRQSICHQILGTTFKDIDKAMQSIIAERQLTPDQQEELELRDTHPEKWVPIADLELEFKVNKHVADPVKTSPYREYTREEVAALVSATHEPYVPVEYFEPTNYTTYSRDFVEQLVREHYEYLENEKKKLMERAKWDSQKTNVSAIRTGNTSRQKN